MKSTAPVGDRSLWISALHQFRNRTWREAGVVPLIALLQVAIVAGGAVGLGMMATSMTSTITHYTTVRQAFSRSEQLEQRLLAEAASAKALFAPATAVDGAANCNGGQCRELDIYSNVTTSGGQQARFVAYLAGANGIQRYTYAETTATVPQGLTTDGAPIAGTGFFRDVPVTNLTTDPDVTPTTKAHLLAANVNPVRWAFNYEHQHVTASNDVFYAHYTPGGGAPGEDVIALTVRAKPVSGVTLAGGVFAPTPAPAMAVTVGSSTLYFGSPAMPAQSFGIHEPNYHDAFTVMGACQMFGSTVAVTTPGSTLPVPNVSNQDSGPASFVINPVSPGLCAQVIGDVYGQTSIEQVWVAGPLTASTASLFMSPHAAPPGGYPGSSATVSFSKTWSFTPLSLGFSGCPIVSAVQSQADVPTFSPAPASGVASVIAIATGTCTLTATDQWGETQTISIVVYDDPGYTLNVQPQSGSMNRGDTWTTTTVNASLNAPPPGHSYFPGTANNLNVGIVAQSGTCTWGPPNWQAPGTQFWATDNDPNGVLCSLTFGADLSTSNNPYPGIAPPNITVTLTMNPQPHQQVTVCNTDPLAGSTDWSTNPPTDYMATTASPPCAAAVYALQVSGPGSLSLTVNGGATAFNATAPLISGSSGVTSLAVAVIGVSGPCTVNPSGWQASGTSFSITPGGSAGSCAITVAANGSARQSPQVLNVSVNLLPNQFVYDQCGLQTSQLVYTDNSTTPPTDHYGSGAACTRIVVGISTHNFVIKHNPLDPDTWSYASVECSYYSDGSVDQAASGDFVPSFTCPSNYTGCSVYNPQGQCVGQASRLRRYAAVFYFASRSTRTARLPSVRTSQSGRARI